MPDEIAFCPGCGRKREPDGAFCSGCGRRLDAPTSEAEREPRRPQEGQIPEQKPGAARRSIWVMAIIVGLLALIFLLAIGSGISVGSPQRESLRQVAPTDASSMGAASVQAIVLPTSTPTATSTRIPIPTYKPAPTDTPQPTATTTHTATSIPPPTNTLTNTPTLTYTVTPTEVPPTATPTPILDRRAMLETDANFAVEALLSRDPAKHTALHEFYPPEFQAKCDANEFADMMLAVVSLAEAYAGGLDGLDYVLDEIRIEGDLGFVTYYLERDGKAVELFGGGIADSNLFAVWRIDHWEAWVSPELLAKDKPCEIDLDQVLAAIAQQLSPTAILAAISTATPIAESDAEPASGSRLIIGRWTWTLGETPLTYTIFFEGGKPFWEISDPNGSRGSQELAERPSPEGRRFDIVDNTDGNYLIIDSNGSFQLHDGKDGSVWVFDTEGNTTFKPASATPVSQEREPQPLAKSTPTLQTIVGEWVNDSGDSFTYAHTLFFEGGRPYLEAVRNDGLVTVLKLVELESPRGRRFDIIGDDGIYLLIVPNGNLQSHNQDGSVRTISRPVTGPAHSTTDSAQRPIPRIQFSCSEGRQMVADNHRTIFGAMSIYKLQFRCSPSFAQDGLIYVEWHWNDKWRRATYGITPDGKVRPADSNAQIIDQIAAQGPLALRFLYSYITGGF